ncbi:MAG: class I SAM-dependent methyltransferase [Candidatus Aminicenantes bacterium]|nr:class I SAM-dependent methyltransferase [Candidatus Aminicenantes bacterium]
MPPEAPLASSFRDPAGFVFRRDGVLHRAILAPGRAHYNRLMSSGLYEELTAAGLLVPHEEVPSGLEGREDLYKLIRPEEIPFISYPYEWSFSQLQDAALATLEIERRALLRGLSLVDASAYNIQFRRGRPVLIDTLSLRQAVEGEPWTAYRQYCQHFLAPLAVMALRDVRLGQLLRVHLDGLPLDLAASLLPLGSRRRVSLLLHLHLHARSQKRYEGREAAVTRRKVGRQALLGLVDSLESGTRKLRWRPAGTEWADYYEDTNYTADGLADKRRAVESFVADVRPKTVWDLGGNVGTFSRAAAAAGAEVVSFDIDPACVERNYLRVRAGKEPNILPLLMDLANPSPAAGWENMERLAFLERGPADAVLALALIHHLAIGNNVPLARAARFFARAGRTLLIEFVPKSDSQVKRLLVTREDIFDRYTQDDFERAFSGPFEILRRLPLAGSERTLYVMARKTDRA